ncbi:hypothetical protein MPSEU_000129500 [Mayamaea pseudoterrestris]|nr:hypothetical protein MPSEU_000129500 [Mayamaea pseudoterrestris]
MANASSPDSEAPAGSLHPSETEQDEQKVNAEDGNENEINTKSDAEPQESEPDDDSDDAAHDHESTINVNEAPLAPANNTKQDADSQSLSDEEEILGSIPETVGGTIASPAFCLLAGCVMEDNVYRPANIAITCLPATLGRHRMSDDENFISMGKLRVLSRQMLRIDYRTRDGTLLHEKGKFSFVKDKAERKFIGSIPVSPDEAFFSVTSLGKNNIHVNGKRLSQGQSVQVANGDAIKVSCYMLYFLLPTQAPTQTMQFGASSPKRKAPTTKKRPVPLTVVSTAMPSIITKKKKIAAVPTATSTQSAISGGTTGSNVGGWLNLQIELDATPTDELLVQCVDAIDAGSWDRRLGMLGNTIAYRAVVACATDPRMQNQDVESNGVERNDVLNWINDSYMYGEWSRKIQTKVESKTFIANLTKAMTKAGYTRTTNLGRFIRWNLPGISVPNTNAMIGDEGKEPADEKSVEGNGSDDAQSEEEGNEDEAPSGAEGKESEDHESHDDGLIEEKSAGQATSADTE